jgi:putative ABC transport system permease protein
MQPSAIIKTSWRALLTNKSRSFLTMLGVIIGIASVIIVLSVGASAQSLIVNQISSIGSNLIVIFPGASDKSGPPASVFGIVLTTLKNSDLEAIRDSSRVKNVEAATGYVRGVGTIAYGGQVSDTTFMGVDADYIKVEDTQVERGVFFTEDESQSLAKVTVIGSTLAQDLFGDQNPLNRQIKIKKEYFTVIGVFKERGPVAFQSPDTYAFVPIKTAQKILLGINHLSFARVKVGDPQAIDETLEQIRLTMREEHDLDSKEVDNFDIRSSAEALGVLTTVTNAVTYFLSAVAAISLLVGGIGIMNIMFVAITERTREIGLRKAIGARKQDIVSQFITEAVFISLIGGLIGLLIGIGISYVIAIVITSLGYEWQFQVTTISLVLSISFATIIGYIIGIYQAYKTSRLDPIEALRYE